MSGRSRPPVPASAKPAQLPWFARSARAASRWLGHPVAFFAAAAFVLAWALSGPLFGFSDTWQLVINTSTTILTFLMVFLLQSTQNRDAEAVQLKLDELIRAVEGARNWMVGVDLLSDEERERLQAKFTELGERAREERDGKPAGRLPRPSSDPTQGGNR